MARRRRRRRPGPPQAEIFTVIGSLFLGPIDEILRMLHRQGTLERESDFDRQSDPAPNDDVISIPAL